MRLHVGRVDHEDLLFAAFGSQPFHHAGEDPHIAPPLRSVVERLGWTILMGRIAPPQPIAIDEDYAAQNSPVIDPRLAMALREERLQPLHLLVGQPEQVAHHHPRQFGAVNHAGRETSSRSMRPEPNELAQAATHIDDGTQNTRSKVAALLEVINEKSFKLHRRIDLLVVDQIAGLRKS